MVGIVVGRTVVGIVVGRTVVDGAVDDVCILGRLVPGGKAVGAEAAEQEQWIQWNHDVSASNCCTIRLPATTGSHNKM